MNLTGNTIFIPGATSGIGLAFAVALHERGNTVIVGGRRTALLDAITTDHTGIESVVIDTADQASIEAATSEVTSRYPDLNVLIAMAGIMQPEDLTSSDFLATAEATVVTNLLGPIRLIGALTTHLASQQAATIMTVSSGLAFTPLSLTPTYCATKAAIHSFTESLRIQLADTSVEVIELVPPAVRTTLMGMQDADHAMPLSEFIDEVMSILDTAPETTQVLVQRVKQLRFSEANGNYGDVVQMLNATH